MSFNQSNKQWVWHNSSISWWLKHHTNTKLNRKNRKLYDEGIWGERSQKNKILPWFTNRTYKGCNTCSSIKLYWEDIKVILHGQNTPIEFNRDCSIFKGWRRPFLSSRRRWKSSWPQPYLSVIKALMNLANNTRLDIAFSTFASKICHWNYTQKLEYS